MKKLLNISLTVIVFLLALLIGFSTSQPRKKSNILVEKTKVEKRADKKIVIHIPMASLPKIGREEKKNLDTVLGTVIQSPSNEKVPDSKKLVMLRTKENETVVLANIPYVHTLELVYMNKNVMLKGNWLKNAVIFGKEFKSFWIEDISFINQEIK